MTTRRYLWLAAAVAAFVATRAWLLCWFEPLLDRDLETYWKHAVQGIDLQQTPYEAVPLEYPPAAWWVIAAPRLWSSQPFYASYLLLPQADLRDFIHEYAGRFRLLMAGFDLASFGLLLLIVQRRRAELTGAAAWAYVAITTALGHVLYDRIDLGLLCCFLLWAYAWLRGDTANRGRGAVAWQALAYAALGLGISYKLIPTLAAPLAVIADLRTIRTPRDVLRQGAMLLVFATTALGPFLYYYGVAGPRVISLFQYHGERGIEIESLYASLLLVLQPFGLVVQVMHDHGSANLASTMSGPLATVSTVLLLLLLGGTIAKACWPRNQFDRVASYRLGCWTMAAAVVLSKVISAQYMIWALPILLLLGVELLSQRQFVVWIVTLTLIAGLTTAVFPYLWFADVAGDGSGRNLHPLVPDLNWLPCLLLVVRNGLLLSVVAWAGVRFARK